MWKWENSAVPVWEIVLCLDLQDAEFCFLENVDCDHIVFCFDTIHFYDTSPLDCNLIDTLYGFKIEYTEKSFHTMICG